MAEHTVHLPYPSRTSDTTGRCACGWTVTYQWGGHGDAVQTAGDHIEQEERTEWIETQTIAGDRTVMPGRSL